MHLSMRNALLAALVTAGLASLPNSIINVSHAEEVDLDAVFRCSVKDDAGKQACSGARNLILNNCTVCHTFVPIVMQQFDKGGWQSLLDRHVSGGRINQLSPEDVAKIRDYLAANFNSEHPQPNLPPELLGTWTSY
jgi:hypothetical protein